MRSLLVTRGKSGPVAPEVQLYSNDGARFTVAGAGRIYGSHAPDCIAGVHRRVRSERRQGRSNH